MRDAERPVVVVVELVVVWAEEDLLRSGVVDPVAVAVAVVAGSVVVVAAEGEGAGEKSEAAAATTIGVAQSLSPQPLIEPALRSPTVGVEGV